MNGNGTAEHYAELAAADAARATEIAGRAESKAEVAVNSSLRVSQMVAKVDREVTEIRREMNDGFSELASELRSLKSLPNRLPSMSKDDFETTQTGSHFIVPADQLDDMLDRRKDRDDAAHWRGTKRRLRQLAIAVFVGVATFLGEHVVKWLAFHNW